jgi:hypothetical protein
VEISAGFGLYLGLQMVVKACLWIYYGLVLKEELVGGGEASGLKSWKGLKQHPLTPFPQTPSALNLPRKLSSESLQTMTDNPILLQLRQLVPTGQRSAEITSPTEPHQGLRTLVERASSHPR